MPKQDTPREDDRATPSDSERIAAFVAELSAELQDLYARHPEHFYLCGCETGLWAKLHGCAVCEDCCYSRGVNICAQSIAEEPMTLSDEAVDAMSVVVNALADLFPDLDDDLEPATVDPEAQP